MTKQRKMLLDYFSRHTHEALSARQIAGALGEDRISVSAVYRNLASLEEDNQLKRVSKAGSHEVFFQYTDLPACREKIHLSCKCCGKMFHLNPAAAELLVRTISEKDGFCVDRSETVLYGICKACQK